MSLSSEFKLFENLNCYVSTKQLASMLGVSVSTIYDQVKMGKIPYLRVGNRYRFNVQDVERALNEVGCKVIRKPSRNNRKEKLWLV